MLKKYFIFTTFILFSALVVRGQEVRLGGGLSYGTVIKNAGLNVRADFRVHPQWSVVPHFNWFIGKERYGIKYQWNAINVDGHYIFEMDESWMVYPLLGFNIATVGEKVRDITFSDTEIGINLGFGSEYKLDKRLSGFGEVKYVIGDADQAVFTFGICYLIAPK